MARFPGIVLAQDVRRSYRISMRSETASRAPVGSPLGFVTLHAGGPVRQSAGAGLRGIGFFHKRDADACCFRFVRDVLPLAAMRPQPDFLLTFRVEVLPIGDVSDIANHQQLDLAFFGPLHERMAHFMLQITRPALLFGKESRLTPLQPTPAAGTLALAVLPGLQFSQPLDSVLLVGTQHPASDDARLFAISDGCWMNLTQVYRCRVGARCSFWQYAIRSDQMPAIMAGGSIPDQSCLKKGGLGQGSKVGWQRNLHRGQSSGASQEQEAILQADTGTFPDSGAPALLVVGVLRVQSKSLAGFGRLTGFVEGLLCSVSTVGMQGGWPTVYIFPAFALFRLQPDPLLAVEAIVRNEHIGIDTPTLGIQGIGFCFGQGAGKLDGMNHGCGFLPGLSGWGGATLSIGLAARTRTAKRMAWLSDSQPYRALIVATACISSGSKMINFFWLIYIAYHQYMLYVKQLEAKA